MRARVTGGLAAGAVVMDFADLYVWFINNKWWLIAVVPFALVVIVLRMLNPK